MKPSTLRRLTHAGTVLILVPTVFYPGLLRWVVCGVAGFVLFFDIIRIRNAKFNSWLTSAFPAFRQQEMARISGASYLWLGYSLAAAFPLPAASIGILAAGLADPAASLTGSRWGRPGTGKSLIGSAACFVVIAAVALSFSTGFPVALAAALVGALLERFSGRLDDNLLIAPGVAGAILALA